MSWLLEQGHEQSLRESRAGAARNWFLKRCFMSSLHIPYMPKDSNVGHENYGTQLSSGSASLSRLQRFEAL